MKSEWELKSKIRSYEANPHGDATLASICNLFQECASRHAEHLRIGFELLKEQGLMWVLARIGVEVKRYPSYGESVTVHTWLNGTQGPFAMREFLLFDSSADTSSDSSSVPVARSSYAWLAIDIHTRNAIRPNKLVETLPESPKRESLNAKLGKIAVPDTLMPTASVYTRASDLDIQQHINNARFVAWMEDALAERSTPRNIRKAQINFIAEAKAGEVLSVFTGAFSPNPESEAVVVFTRDSTDLVRAKVEF